MSCHHLLAAATGGCRLCPRPAEPQPAPSLADAPAPPEIPTAKAVALAAAAAAAARHDADRREDAQRVPLSLDEIVAERCKRSLAYYVRRQWEHTQLASVPLEWGPHLDAMCLHIQGQLEDAERKRDNESLRLRYLAANMEPPPPFQARAQNLLINTPPRSLKTIILTLANAWAWIRWPWLQIVYLSATPKVVHESGRLFRDAVTSIWYQRLFVRSRWFIREDQDAISSTGNSAGGKRLAVGLDSRVLGISSDWTCLDDAHQMDDSPDAMAKTIENYDLNVSSRQNDARWALRTAIMQRARRNDFSEHVLKLGWFHLRMPMEFMPSPSCGCIQCEQGKRGEPNAFGWCDWRTTPGELIHPRFTREYLAERLKTLRAHGYAGQMQQEPRAKEGNEFKLELWRFVQIEGTGAPMPRPAGMHTGPAHILKRTEDGKLLVDWVEVSVDPTGGSTSSTASALGITINAGQGERRFILEDMTPGPQSWLPTMVHIKRALARASDISGWTTKIIVRIEAKALGRGAIDDLVKAIGDGAVKNARGQVVIASVKPYEPTGRGDKERRAEFLEPMLDAGLIHLLDGAPWLFHPPEGSDETIVDEFAAFPHGSRDDRVDSVAQCFDEHRSPVVDWVDLFKATE